MILHGQASSLLSVLRLKLLHLVEVVVNQPETCAATAAKRCVETEKLDALRVIDLVHGGKLLGEVRFRNVGHSRMDDIQDELLAAKQGILLELARPDGEFRHPYRLARHEIQCEGFCFTP